MIASEVWDSETKSTEFVCSRAARKALNIVPEMSSALVRMSLSLFLWLQDQFILKKRVVSQPPSGGCI